MIDEECLTLKAEYSKLCQEFDAFCNVVPNIDGAQKLQRRIARDSAALERFINTRPEMEEDPIWLEQRRNQLQGFRNNFNNYGNKLRVAKWLDGVTAVGKVFQYPLAPGIEEARRRVQSDTPPEVVKTEVDIVANHGNAWIHVRSVKIPDVNSLNWTGLPGHHKGLEQKLRDLMTISQSMEQWIRWRPPDVAVYCPESFGADVIEEIEAMGVVAISGDLDNLRVIPQPPPPPTITNLDVTTICALVSEISHRCPDNPEIVEWSQRVSHWQDCVEHERRERLLPILEPYIDNKPLITTERAVQQFETLLHTFNGPRETERWKALLPKLTIFRTADEASWLSKRVSDIEDLTELQYSVFGLGDTQRALTITCNQKLVQKLKHNGVRLECLVHRPVWLTGL